MVELNVNDFEVEVTQRNMSKSSLQLCISTNNGDIDLYMSVEQIQKLIDDTQKSLDEYKKIINR